MMKKAWEVRRPELIFDGPHYTIEKIPLNYRIFIKWHVKKKNPNAGIDRDCYSSLDFGIEEAHRTAQDCLQTYFAISIRPT